MSAKDQEIAILKTKIEELEKKLEQKQEELTQIVLLWSKVVSHPK